VPKVRILFVGSSALANVVRHLFHGRPEFEVVGVLPGVKNLAQSLPGSLPELIVASVKPVETGVCSAVLAIKESSPSSKLILISPLTDLTGDARRCGADACLDQEALVHRLVPTASALSARSPQIQFSRR
jgi:hypothetical protein